MFGVPFGYYGHTIAIAIPMVADHGILIRVLQYQVYVYVRTTMALPVVLEYHRVLEYHWYSSTVLPLLLGQRLADVVAISAVALAVEAVV